MKKQNTLFAMASIGAISILAACSSDEPANTIRSADNVIRFTASADYTRAGDITVNNLTEFQVYAYLGHTGTGNPTPYMNNVKVTKTANNLWTYSPVSYWPSTGTVSFYAYAPEGWIGDNGPLRAVPWDNSSGNVPASTDLVYAVSPDMTGQSGSPNAQVIFNFRHALSKVTVKMSSSNTKLRVQVSNVAIAGLMSKGNFYFPSGNTAEVPGTSNVCTWGGQNTPEALLLHVSQSSDEVINLTTTPTEISNENIGLGESVFVIPQLLTWRSNGMGNDTYITVMCSIYDAQTGTKLWPNDNTPEENKVSGSMFGDGLLKFPLSTSSFSELKPGYHYLYNLVINSNEEMGAIDFGDPTVDTYMEVNTSYQ